MSEPRVLFAAPLRSIYMAMLPAMREIKRCNIAVDIFVPTPDEFNHYAPDYDKTAALIESAGFSVFRDFPENKEYDVLYSAYTLYGNKILPLNKIKYHVRFNYGVGGANKAHCYSQDIFNYYDFILCLAEAQEMAFLSGFAKSFSIGNIKLADYKRTRHTPVGKKTILFLPTWGNASNINTETIKKLSELTDKYNISAKMHSITTYYDEEQERYDLFKNLSNSINLIDESTPISELLNEADVVLSDLSSAAFDAIAGDVPLALFGLGEPVYFGGRLCLHQQLVQNDIVPGTNDINELESVIEKALSPEYFEKQQKLKKEMFPFEGRECLDAFMRFQDDLFNDRVDSWYIATRRAIRENILKEAKENHELREWLESRERVIEDKDKIIESIISENEKNIEEIKRTYESSTSWKLTKPFRALSSLIKK